MNTLHNPSVRTLERKASETKNASVAGEPKPRESNGPDYRTRSVQTRFTIRGPRDQRVSLNVVEIKDFSGYHGELAPLAAVPALGNNEYNVLLLEDLPLRWSWGVDTPENVISPAQMTRG